jgi:hypothetical protein
MIQAAIIPTNQALNPTHHQAKSWHKRKTSSSK